LFSDWVAGVAGMTGSMVWDVDVISVGGAGMGLLVTTSAASGFNEAGICGISASSRTLLASSSMSIFVGSSS